MIETAAGTFVDDTSRLSTHELETAVRWFTYHMPSEQRGRLMAEMPVLYAKLFPGVSPKAVLERVAAGLEGVREDQRDRRATQIDGMLGKPFTVTVAEG